MGSKYNTPHDQFVIAYLAHPDKADTIISHALPLAQMLRKGLILLYVEDPRYGGLSTSEAEPLLSAHAKRLREQHADTNFCALRGDTKEIITALPMMLYGVVVVAEADTHAPRRTPTHPKQVLRNFAESKIAYLTVQQPRLPEQHFANVALTIDYRRESKEKLIWASYFARFNNSQLHILSQTYRDEGLHNMWRDNIRFMEKIFSSLGITSFSRHQYTSKGPFAEPHAAEYAAEQGYELLISTTTDIRDRDNLELIIGTAEQRVVRNPGRLPILFLNPRDDLFVLCD
ncbi:MAG: hypothetical protein IJ764_05195 [Bacteroidales bacterium]|nr:hypothetical protein [Bacteroidales bacterium]